METPSQIKFKTVDEYLAAVPENVKRLLEEVRITIKQTAPDAQESISYNMPAFTLNGVLVYYAAWKSHIGFYPASVTFNTVFREELIRYKTTKGAIQFPIGEGIPTALIKSIVEYRINENLEKAKLKKGK